SFYHVLPCTLSILLIYLATDLLISLHFFFLLLPRPPTSTLFPYTTLFRSRQGSRHGMVVFHQLLIRGTVDEDFLPLMGREQGLRDRKSTRLNSSHVKISYAVFCLKKKKKNTLRDQKREVKHINSLHYSSTD